MIQSFTALAAPPPTFRYRQGVALPSDKMALRDRMRGLRRRLAAETSGANGVAVRLPLARLPPFQTFSAYVAQGSEIDPGPLVRRLAETGAAPALPVAATREDPLVFRRWDPLAALTPDAFGVPSPPTDAEVILPDLVISPLLAFDRRGGRLGQGGGHYDRAMKVLRGAKATFVLGLAYAGQEVDEVPMEPNDQRLNAILTETEYIPVVREN